jgi:hypothetical protein
MNHPEEAKSKAEPSANEDQRLVLDGTANLDYPDVEPVPRVKGLIELLNQYLGKKPDQNL